MSNAVFINNLVNHYYNSSTKRFTRSRVQECESLGDVWGAIPWMKDYFHGFNILNDDVEEPYRFSVLQKTMPTNSEKWRNLIAEFVIQINKHNKNKFNREPINNLQFLMVPSRKINLLTIQLPTNAEYLTIIDESLLPFIVKFAHLFAQLLPDELYLQYNKLGMTLYNKEEWMIKSINQKEPIIEAIVNIFLEYLIIGTAFALEPLKADKDKIKLAEHYALSWKLFILAREFAPAFERYLANPEVTTVQADQIFMSQVNTSSFMELEKDEYGFLLLSGFVPNLLMSELEILYMMLDVLYESSSLIKDGGLPNANSLDNSSSPLYRNEKMNFTKDAGNGTPIHFRNCLELIFKEIKNRLYPSLLLFRKNDLLNKIVEW